MDSDISSAISSFEAVLQSHNIKPDSGLGTELFLFVSTLTPIMNVDLLVTNSKNQVLLSWRDDEISGQGWYIPGGCLRLRELLEERIHRCAMSEFGTDVNCDMTKVHISENQSESSNARSSSTYEKRSHFVSFLYQCSLKDESSLVNCDQKELLGHLGWFDSVPKNFLGIQYYYIDYLNNWFKYHQNSTSII